MHIKRIVIRNFRNFAHLDVPLCPGVTCVIGENNTGKTNLLHAIRLAVDADLPSQYRQLRDEDVHSQADLTVPNQVLVSVEFCGNENAANECLLLCCCGIGEDVASLHFRFRPRSEIREAIESGDHDGDNLSIVEDYHFELTGGGSNDPATVNWDEELGLPLGIGGLEAFHVEYIPALRDVQQSLRQTLDSSLGRLLRAVGLIPENQDAPVNILGLENAEIEAQPGISSVVEVVGATVARAARETFAMDMKLDVTAPSSAFIVRSLKAMLSTGSNAEFAPARDGFGLNNTLYISMLLEWFRKRMATVKAARQLLLIEEPESHLHPQLQRALYSALSEHFVQVILTTHSADISSHAPIESYVTLTLDGTPATVGRAPYVSGALTAVEAENLSRFLDATRSPLLHARKVLLVEGAAELFLLPVLAKHVLGINLDRRGIAVVPIYGNRFAPYAKLFGPEAIPKKCAIVAAGDGGPENLCGIPEDCLVLDDELAAMENTYVSVFCCAVTFERALTVPGTLPMLAAAAEVCGFSSTAKQLREGHDLLCNGTLDLETHEELLSTLRGLVVNAVVECGKVRFAQIASKYARQAKSLPQFIQEAVKWLIEP